ncbi:MAG: RNA methyltransferase [Simkaniaceae bacterium]
MEARKISSLQHPIVKHLKRLRIDKKYRKIHSSILIFGMKMVKEAASCFPIKKLLIAEKNLNDIPAEETFFVSTEILKKISDLPSPEPIAAEIPMPAFPPLMQQRFLLALDKINDPGNLGTLFRSALAFGVEGILLLKGSVDPYNDKALRASKGAVFHMPFYDASWKEIKQHAEKHSMQMLVADLNGENFESAVFTFPLIIVLGNESLGISKEAKQLCHSITIPMANTLNSLNVSIAGGILLYHLGKAYGNR